MILKFSFKGELNDGTWLEKREQLMFASFQFEAVHHQLKPSTVDYDPGTTLDGDDEGMKNFTLKLKIRKSTKNLVLKTY